MAKRHTKNVKVRVPTRFPLVMVQELKKLAGISGLTEAKIVTRGLNAELEKMKTQYPGWENFPIRETKAMTEARRDSNACSSGKSSTIDSM